MPSVRDLNKQWVVSPKEAIALQKELAALVVRQNRLGPVKTVAGIDVGFQNDIAHAVVAVLSFPELNLLDYSIASQPVRFPYVPGLLTFREGPAVLAAFAKLADLPDLLIFDGQGLAHPRRLGIASHLGVLLDLPAIGCAKSRLCGRHAEPGVERGSYVPLIDRGETIGAVVRTRSRVKPVYVSIGHRIDLPTSIRYVLNCCRGYRLPETTRWADRIAGEKR